MTSALIFPRCAENGTDRSERLVQRDGEAEQKAERQHGHHRADAEEDDHRDAGGEQAADQVDQSGAEQVPHAFHVGHDARDQGAGLIGIVERNRKMRDVRLHFFPKFRNQALGRFRQQLGQRKGRDALNDGGRQNDQDQAPQQFDVMFGDDTVDQEFGGVGKHQSRHPVDDHQQEADRQQAPAGTHQFPNGGKDGPQPLGSHGRLGLGLEKRAHSPV